VIVDGHQHFWNLERSSVPWMTAEHAAIARTFEPADLEPLLESHGIAQTILVQGVDTDEDTDALLEYAAGSDWIGAVTAWLPLESPGRTRERLDQLEGEPKFRAVRHLIHGERDPHWIVRPPVLESIALVEEAGLLLELPVVFPRHFGDVLLLAQRFPTLTIVIDHLGKPPIGTDRMSDWEAALRAAARNPNVVAKVSGLNTAVSRTDWTADDFRPSVEIALDCFGPDRLLCGSDWPYALLNGDFDRIWRTTRCVVELVAPDASAELLGGTACRLYSLASENRRVAAAI
jgi:L-fuconolactonase